MAYITHGIVQVEINGGNHVIMINPTQNYALNHAKQDYIVFIDITNMDAKIFNKPAKTAPVTDVTLIQPLINAAFGKTNIEIEVDIISTDIIIRSIKIPAIS